MTPEEFWALRQQLGLTQTALAEALGVTRRTVYAWEKGVVELKPWCRLALERLSELASEHRTE